MDHGIVALCGSSGLGSPDFKGVFQGVGPKIEGYGLHALLSIVSRAAMAKDQSALGPTWHD